MRFYIGSDAHSRLTAFIDSINVEVGGLGYAKLEHDDKGNLDVVWTDTFLIPQEVSAAEVDFGSEALMYGIERAAEDGVLDDPDFVWVSWHSHHTMKAFWSTTDEACIQTYGEMGVKHLLSFVGCHDRSYKMRFDHFGVEHAGVHIGQVTQSDQVLKRDTDEFYSEVLAEIDANVVEKKAKLFNKVKQLPDFKKPEPQWMSQIEMDERQYKQDVKDLMATGMTKVEAEAYAVGLLDDPQSWNDGYLSDASTAWSIT